MATVRQDPLAGKYTLSCTHPDCGGTLITDVNHSMGLTIGSMVAMDASQLTYGRCPRCQRYKMKVISGPPQPAPKMPKGFSQVPEK